MGTNFTVATAEASFRAATEDRLAVIEHDGGLVVVVADGAGGLSGGAGAAEMGVDGVTKAVLAGDVGTRGPDLWMRLLAELDVDIEADAQAGESTIVVVSITGSGTLIGASCGDSGALIVGGYDVDDLTTDQHRKRRLGSRRAIPVAFTRPLLDGVLVVASDGLLSYCRRNRIAAA